MAASDAAPEPVSEPAARPDSSLRSWPGPPGAVGSPEQSLARRAEAAVIVLASTLALAFWARLPSTLPADDDYRAAAEHVAAGFGSGDAVVLHPAWAERARQFLGVSPVLAVPAPDREDFARTRRLWLFGLPDVPRSDYDGIAARMAARYRAVEPPRRFGRVAVALYENPSYGEPRFDFGAELGRAEVAIGLEKCPWDGRAHRCRHASWLYVAHELHEIEFLPRRCLWARPAGPVPLTIRYPAVPLGRALRIRGGNASQVAWRRNPGWAPVTLSVEVAGGKLGSLTVEVADGREHAMELDTSAWAGTAQEVAFAVASDRPEERNFCFEASAW